MSLFRFLPWTTLSSSSSAPSLPCLSSLPQAIVVRYDEDDRQDVNSVSVSVTSHRLPLSPLPQPHLSSPPSILCPPLLSPPSLPPLPFNPTFPPPQSHPLPPFPLPISTMAWRHCHVRILLCMCAVHHVCRYTISSNHRVLYVSAYTLL